MRYDWGPEKSLLWKKKKCESSPKRKDIRGPARNGLSNHRQRRNKGGEGGGVVHGWKKVVVGGAKNDWGGKFKNLGKCVEACQGKSTTVTFSGGGQTGELMGQENWSAFGGTSDAQELSKK